MNTFEAIETLCKKSNSEILEELGPCDGAFHALGLVRKFRTLMSIAPRTPIEVIADALKASGATIDDIFVPEQCLTLYMPDGSTIQILAEPFANQEENT